MLLYYLGLTHYTMREFIITTSLAGSLVILGITSRFFESIMIFVLVGGIPLTTTSIAPGDMLGAWLVVMVLGITFLVNKSNKGKTALKRFQKSSRLAWQRLHKFLLTPIDQLSAK